MGKFFKGQSSWRTRKPFYNREWLDEEYSFKKRTPLEIAIAEGVTRTAIFYWLRKHKIKIRSPKESAVVSKKSKGRSGNKNPMYGRRGCLNPRWLGGISDERKAYNQKPEWKKVCKSVWVRDKATCQRCFKEKRHAPESEFHIHHIVGFPNKEKRYDEKNLVLLCVHCHRFVHSRKNVGREFLG